MDFGAGWDKTNTALEIGYQTAALVDWGQTLNFNANHPLGPKEHEMNPILGKHPSRGDINTYFALTGAAHVLGSALLHEPYRMIFQGVSLGIEADAAFKNYKLGIGVKF